MLDVALYNFRDFTSDSHRTVDDMPYGGGAGMVLKPEPLFKALDVLAEDGVPRRVVLLSPQGAPFSQKVAEVFSKEDRRIVFICGRYEGIDERVMSRVDEEISIGDYVMTGGELAALVIIDAVTRLLPGALGDAKSIEDESFTWGLLDYPQYTRPREYCGLKVPDVLLSGNHKDIIAWRRGQALKKTLAVRPDLLETAKLSDEDQRMISDLRDGYGSK